MHRFAVLAASLVAVLLAAGSAQAAFPGGNGRIAFTRVVADAPNDIWAIDADGSDEVNLTSSPQDERYPDFSPDGRRIAYVELADGGLSSRLMVMDADGTDRRPLATSAVFGAFNVPSWSPDGEELAVDDFDGAIRIHRVRDGALLDTLEPPDCGTYANPAWRPTAGAATDIAVLRVHCDGAGNRDVVRLTASGEVNLTATPGDVAEGGHLEWTPDGGRVLYRDRFTSDVVAVGASGGRTPVHDAEGSGDGHAVSPDGGVLLWHDGAIGSSTSAIHRKALPGGTASKLTTGTYPTWGAEGRDRVSVALAAFRPSGVPAEGQLLSREDLVVRLTVRNEGTTALSDLRWAGGRPLAVDGRSTGGAAITGASEPPAGLDLAPGATAEAVYAVTTTREGLAALHAKVTATAPGGADVEGAHSLLLRITNAQRLTQALGEALVLRAVDQYLLKSARDLQAALAKRARRLHAGLKRHLSRAERKRWFGDPSKLRIGNRDRATALQRGVAAATVAAGTPKRPFKGHSVAALNRAYDDAFKKEVGDGVRRYVKGYADLGRGARKALDDSWAEGIMNAQWLMGTATPEERAQVEAFWGTFARGVGTDATNLYKTLAAEIPRWRENGTYAWQAMQESEAAFSVLGNTRKGVAFLTSVVEEESAYRKALLRIADEDPVRFQRESAERDAKILNLGLPVVLDTLLGAGVTRVAAGGRRIKVTGDGASVIAAGEAGGWLDDSGRVVKGRNRALDLAGDEPVTGLPLQTAAELDLAEAALEAQGGTLVQASDVGNVYALPNLGGVPHPTLDAKAGILRRIEEGYAAATGRSIQLAEVLKTSSPLRKPGGVAKLELTAGKTGKAAMVDAGMPADALGEAVYWTSPRSPRRLPGFSDLPKARQDAALHEWELAKARYAKWQSPPPGSKEAKLKALVGTRGRVPLDDAPNASGLQRFVTAEFEEVTVRRGDATAKLIRVKHYEIEVVDTTRGGLVVNRKAVVDDLARAAPQTADADAVAVGKVVGRDPATGAPVIAPLDRAEREFVMSRYVDANVRARRSGAVPDLAEHGVTMVMEDASARAAGFLLPSYGAPFLPESVARGYLRRIAPFVKPSELTDEQMLEQMLALVRSEGGFGQHAVVVTADARYLGEVPFERW